MSTRPLPGAGPTDTQIPAGTTLFGVYEILGVLGGGGMGWVYRARHQQLSSLRAIKVIRPDLTANANMEQLFVREAKALMQIKHDAVVHCHDLLSSEGRVYLIMELVEGPTLEEILRDGPISTSEVRALMQRIGSGLAAAHALGVIHRDVSPGNIILPNGRADEAKLIDFGVAAVAAVPGQTIAGDFKGKLAYASPEQFGLFGGKVDARSDIYSLGLTLAEAASGAPIPMGETFYEAVEIRKNTPRIPPNVSAELQADILPLLRPDPKDRPQSAANLGAALPQAATRPARELKPDQEQDPQPAPNQPHWLIPLIYSASAVGFGLGLGLMVWLFRTAGTPPVPTPLTPAVAPAPAGAVVPTPPPKAVVIPSPSPVVKPPVTPPVTTLAGSGTVTRAQVIDTAAQLANFSWTCRDTNRHAACIRTVAYTSDWQPNESLTGEAYNWGGADSPTQFQRRLTMGLAAGSHKRHGVSRCTTGIDCSGFVAYCWGHQTGSHDFSTTTMGSLATRITGNVYRDLKPGDALNDPGSHIVLFAGYRPDGNPTVYEASGSAGRVIRNDRMTWRQLARYYPLRYNRLIDP